ncbi:MAG: mechanosensitive ion channel domain-containing protein [Bacteroidota bacterium]
MDTTNINNIVNQGAEMAVEYAPKFIMAILTLIIGFWIINRITRLTDRVLASRDMDLTLRKFLSDLIGVVLKVLLLISAASMVGVQTTSFVALLGAAGLAVGLALQGSLSNFAGGVMILIFKPFKIGDLVEAQGVIGVVKSISVFVTELTSPDNKLVIVPNGAMISDSMVNYSTDNQLRVDLTVGVSYDANIQQARDVIMKAMEAHPKVLSSPAPSVSVSELADSSVNLAVRPYATVADYWDVYFGVTEDVKNALDAAGIEIPYPQQVVHE